MNSTDLNLTFIVENFISNESLQQDLELSFSNTTLTNTSAITKTFRYHDNPYRIIGTIIMIIIFFVGVVGNIMVILVVLKSKTMRSPTNCYLVSLAFADLLLLLSATLPTILEFHLIQDEFVAGSLACRSMVFSQYLGFNLSSLSITALTAERYVAICRPMKAHVICTIGRAKKIIAMLWLFGFCYSAPWLGLITTRETYANFEECTYTLSRDQYLIYYLTDLVVMYFVPVIVNIILYTLISKTLYYSNPISIAFGGGSSNTFGVVAATASLCRSNGYDSSSKFGSHKGSSISSSFKSFRNNENRTLIRKKFANDSIKSFTLYRNESRNNKCDGNLKKRFLKRENSFFAKDSFDSNRIWEREEEDENDSSVKKDKNEAIEPNEHIQLENQPNKKEIKIQNVDNNEFELENHTVEDKAKMIERSGGKEDLSASVKKNLSSSGKENLSASGKEDLSASVKKNLSSSGKEDLSASGEENISASGKEDLSASGKENLSAIAQLKRQNSLFDGIVEKETKDRDLNSKKTSEDSNLCLKQKPEEKTKQKNSENNKSNSKLNNIISNVSKKFKKSDSLTTTAPITRKVPMKPSLSQPSTKSNRTTTSSINSRHGRLSSSNFSGFSMKRKKNKTSFSSNIDSSNKAITFMASSLSQASTYGSNPIQSRTQIIKMLVVVVSLFAVLWLPYRAFVVYNSFKKPRFEGVWLMLACRTMVHANSAINPILYNAMSAKFKKAFKNLLMCGRKPAAKPTNRRGAVDCNLNYSRKEAFFNMYEKNYREILQDRAKALKS